MAFFHLGEHPVAHPFRHALEVAGDQHDALARFVFQGQRLHPQIVELPIRCALGSVACQPHGRLGSDHLSRDARLPCRFLRGQAAGKWPATDKAKHGSQPSVGAPTRSVIPTHRQSPLVKIGTCESLLARMPPGSQRLVRRGKNVCFAGKLSTAARHRRSRGYDSCQSRGASSESARTSRRFVLFLGLATRIICSPSIGRPGRRQTSGASDDLG